MPNLQKSLKSLQVKVNQIIPGTLGLSDSLVNVPNRLGFSYVKLLGNANELIQAYNTTVTPQYGVPVMVQWNGTQYVVLGRDVQRYPQWSSSAYLPLHGDTHQWMGGDTTWIHSEQFYPLSVSPSGSSLFIGPYAYNWLGNWIYGGNTGTNTITLPSDPSKQKIMLLYLDGPTGNPAWLPGTEAPLYTNIYQLLPYLPSFNTALGIPLAMVGIPSGTTSLTWDNLYDVRQFFGGSSGGTGSSGTGSYGNVYGSASVTDGHLAVFNTDGYHIKDGGAVPTGSSGIPDAPSDGNTYGRKNATWSAVSGSSGITDAPSDGNIYGRKNAAWAIAPTGSNYSLPTGSSSILGGYRVGLGLEACPDGTLNVTGSFASDHNILSTTHGDTLVDTVVRGDILYGNATPKWARLALPGTPTGKIVQATATDVGWSTNPITIGASASISGVNSGDQTITLTSDVTGSGTGSFATTIANSAVTLAKMADMATASLFYRKTAGNGPPEVNTLSTLKTDLGLSGNNSGDQVVPVNEAGSAHNFLTAYNSTTGAWSKSQPSTSDISGLGTLAVVNDAASDGSTYGRKNGAWSAVSAGGGDISGTGIVGQVAEFVTNTKTLRASNLIAPANLLTISAAGAYTLTIPATGTVAMLNQANSFTLINPLTTIAESWIGPSSTTGIYFKGNNVGIGTIVPTFPFHVVQTDAAGTTDWQSASYISLTRTVADSGGIKNSAALYVFSGYTNAGTYYAPKAIYALLQNASSGTITEASAFMGQVDNSSNGTITTARGLYARITNSGTGTITTAQGVFIAHPYNVGGTITNAYGLYVEAITQGATLNYAIYTNAGKVHFGGDVDISGSLSLSGAFPFQRNITSNLSLINGQCFIIAKYLNLGTYSLTLAGDSRLEIL